MDALTLLKGYPDEALQSFTEPQLQSAIYTASLDVDRETYGQLWAVQVADLAAHNLLVSKNRGSSEASGRVAKKEKTGKREIEFVESSSSSESSADSGLLSTHYGENYVRRRKECSFGITSTGWFH